MDWLQNSHPSVMQNILEHLNISDLANCRLVNSAFNYEACRILQRRQTIAVSSLEKLERYCETFEKSNIELASLRIQSCKFECELFSRVMQNPGTGDIQKLREALQRFMELGGDNIRNMAAVVIPILTFPDALPQSSTLFSMFMLEQLSKMIYEGLRNVKRLHLTVHIQRSSLPEDFDTDNALCRMPSDELPNLEEVTLKMHDLVPGPSEQVIRSFIKTLFSSSRNLKSIHSWSRWDKRDGYILLKDRILDNIAFISSTLRSLTIMETISNADLNTLVSRNFPNLESVEIYLDGLTTSEDSLKAFLSHYQHSLRSLNLGLITSDWRPVRFCSQLPPSGVVLTQLETLVLKFYHGGMVALENVPKLKKLLLYRCSNLTQIISREISQQNLISSQKLQKLEVSGWSHLTDRCFPCTLSPFSFLTSLKIENVYRLQLSEIFQEAKGLQNLSIKYCKGVNDESICGIRSSVLCQSTCHLKILKDSTAEETAELILEAKAIRRERSYIGDLKELRCLTIKGDMSDDSILYGIVNCMKMKRLHLASFTRNFTWRSRLIINYGLKDLVELSMMEDEEVTLP